ncbi:MAG TPA: MFS transporter [Gemmatimonadaceae bacterium]|nr:MFS transporter [Gemmatimonadaceae bacterium]
MSSGSHAVPPVPSPAPPQRHDAYASFQLPDFRWYILCVLTATIAAQAQVLVVSWQVYSITHDPLSLGIIGLSEAIPFIGFSPLAGHAADRRSRRSVTRGALAVLFLCSVALLALSLDVSLIRRAGAWPFYIVIFVNGSARSFYQPARSALGVDIVPRSLYANAVAWRSSTWQGAAVLGPAIGGLVYGFGSAPLAYVMDALLLVIAIFSVWRIRDIPPDASAASSTGSVVEGFLSSLRFLAGQRVLLGAMLLDVLSVLMGGAEALLPVFAADILHVGPEGLGVLRAAPAVGAVIMSLYLAHRAPFARAGRSLLTAVAVFGTCIIGFGLSRSMGLSLVLLGVSGMADNVSVQIRSLLLQTLVPRHLLGRMMSINSIFVGSSNELGAFESGVTARLLGAVPAVIIGGIAALGVVGATSASVPQLRELARIE